MTNKSENALCIHPILPKATVLGTVFILFGLLAGILVSDPALAQNKTATLNGGFAQQSKADGRARPNTSNGGLAQLHKIAVDYLKKTHHYKEGYLLVRKEAEGAIQALQKQGYVISDPASILQKTLTEGNFLAKTLRRGQKGRKFMQQVSAYPLAYSQLDRLASQPVGRRTVVDLVRGPDGYKMLKYMNTNPYGKNLGKMLSKDPKGGDYNKPTGRIYTAKQLTEAIWQQMTSPKPVK